jgi:hypothetical protein
MDKKVSDPKKLEVHEATRGALEEVHTVGWTLTSIPSRCEIGSKHPSADCAGNDQSSREEFH